MSTKAIPRAMLPHTATYKKLTGIDGRGNKTYATGVALAYVRFESAKKNAFTALGEQKNDRAIMFFDCVNSYPVGTAFATGDVLTYSSQDYEVREVIKECAFDSNPHHYEVMLV
jgi:hypothetical protein